jgi:hypothetical protein
MLTQACPAVHGSLRAQLADVLHHKLGMSDD